MRYSELEVKRLLKMSELSLEDQVKVNILNFIRTIHLNQQDFISSSFDSQFFGDLPMTFRKKEGQVMGVEYGDQFRPVMRNFRPVNAE